MRGICGWKTEIAAALIALGIGPVGTARAEVILDDSPDWGGNPTWTGTWTFRAEGVNGHTGSYNDTGFLFAIGGDDTATYTATLPAAGLWSLEMYVGDTLTAVPTLQFSTVSGLRSMTFSTGTANSTDRFMSLGIYELNAGANTIRITSGLANTRTDAMRWARAGLDTIAAVVLDSDLNGIQGVFSKIGTWSDPMTEGSGTRLFNNDDWICNTVGGVAEFTTPVARARYTVQVTWNPRSVWATSALIQVVDADGATHPFRVNQTVENAADATDNNVTWQTLGIYTMDAASKVRFVYDASAGGYVAVDGVRLVYVPDTTEPTVEPPFVPANDATGVGTVQSLEIDFSEPIQKHATAGEKYITLTDLDDGSGNQTIDVTSASVTIGDSDDGSDLVTIDPADFEPSTHYSVRIDAGAIKDKAVVPNNYAGIADDTTWDFTTTAGDTEDPTVEVYSPLQGATAVALGSSLVLDFTEAVQKGSGDLTINDVSHGTDDRTVTLVSVSITDGDDGSDLVTIDPTANLRANRTYAVLIPATSFDDLNGRSYAGIADNTTWRFDTAIDTTPPDVNTFSPANGEQDVAVPRALSLTFSENVEAGAGTITIRNLTDATQTEITVPDAAVTFSGVTMTIAAGTANLVAGKNYAVRISADAIKDYGGVSYPGIDNDTTWAFDTDVTPPSATLTPADESVEVSPNASLTLTFDEAVQAGAGAITIQTAGDARSIAVPSPAAVFAGNVVTIDPGDDLLFLKRYTVQVASGAIKDMAGNAYGIADADTWNFTTEGETIARYTFADATYNSSDEEPNSTADALSFGAGIVTDGDEISSGSRNGLIWGNPDNALFVESIDTLGTTARGDPANAPSETTIAYATGHDAYVEFTVTPESSARMTLSGIHIDYAAVAGTLGGQTMDPIAAVRSSRDGYADDLLTWDPAPMPFGTSLAWATKASGLGADFVGLSAPVTFRIYLADDKNVDDRGHFLDNIRVTGVVVLPPQGTLFTLR